MKKIDEQKLINYAQSIKSDYFDNPAELNALVTNFAYENGIKVTHTEICRVIRKVLIHNAKAVITEPLALYSAKELIDSDLPPLEFCVDGLISHGVSILSAKSKFYKSWMAMQMCLCISQGKPFLGFHTHQSDVLYVDLENDKRLSKERLNLMLGKKTAPNNFFIVNEVPTMEQGFVSIMKKTIDEHPQIKLIVIDVFAKIKYSKKSNESDYDADYRSISELKQFATEKDLAILLISHNRKFVDPTDPFANILGSTALMAACDAAIVIYKENRRDDESNISITGRTVQNNDFKGIFDTSIYQWRLLGTLDDYVEQQQENKYRKNPIVITIKLLLSKSNDGTWCGRLSELKDASYQMDVPIRESPQAIGRQISSISRQLKQYDNISMIEKKNGSGSKRYEFIRTV
ncbi:AAA family ATPase [Butyrivibrio sp. AC2005]|uniref:AAA family ATPase n=1 Tax=Butyrivibrio sp. AC2005 TaxID=1280672 RepID=UPI000414FF29|nr:AAA family ATPase [Butyrivibrio sp. AC2005]